MNKNELRKLLQEHRSEEIEPSANVKDRLDQAFKLRNKRRKILQLPFYQSAAAAILFFFAGAGLVKFFEKPQPIAQQVVQVVKYVDRPVKEVQYIRVLVPSKPLVSSVQKDTLPNFSSQSSENDLAITDVQKGISMGDDTVLQKMMVTIY